MHAGLYEFQVMSFELCNVPATFQRLMEIVLAGLTRDKCLVYLDDIFTNLRSVFQRVAGSWTEAEGKEMLLHTDTSGIPRTHHILSGVSVDPKKTEAIQEFPRPVDLKSLCSFVGLASYCR